MSLGVGADRLEQGRGWDSETGVDLGSQLAAKLPLPHLKVVLDLATEQINPKVGEKLITAIQRCSEALADISPSNLSTSAEVSADFHQEVNDLVVDAQEAARLGTAALKALTAATDRRLAQVAEFIEQQAFWQSRCSEVTRSHHAALSNVASQVTLLVDALGCSDRAALKALIASSSKMIRNWEEDHSKDQTILAAMRTSLLDCELVERLLSLHCDLAAPGTTVDLVREPANMLEQSIALLDRIVENKGGLQQVAAAMRPTLVARLSELQRDLTDLGEAPLWEEFIAQR